MVEQSNRYSNCWFVSCMSGSSDCAALPKFVLEEYPCPARGMGTRTTGHHHSWEEKQEQLIAAGGVRSDS